MNRRFVFVRSGSLTTGVLAGTGVVAGSVFAVLVAAAMPLADEPLDFTQVAAARRPHPRETEVESLLAEAAAAAAGRGGLLLE